jgi:GH25 family lysozyme M1 (1,4-beta-N-acetylmuramidase)
VTAVVADISAAQGKVDWAALSGHVDGVILKASEGTGYRDPQFDANVAGARAHGVPLVGVYHFPRPDLGNSGQAEGQWFAQVVTGVGNVPRIVDIERHPSCTPTRWAQVCTPDWLWALVTAAGVTWDYGNRGDLSTAVRGDRRFAVHRVWEASYPGGTPDPSTDPVLPAPWNRKPDMWQFSDTGRRPGIAGDVDLSYAYVLTPHPLGDNGMVQMDAPCTASDDTADFTGSILVSAKGHVYALGSCKPYGNPTDFAAKGVPIKCTLHPDGQTYTIRMSTGHPYTFGPNGAHGPNPPGPDQDAVGT